MTHLIKWNILYQQSTATWNKYLHLNWGFSLWLPSHQKIQWYTTHHSCWQWPENVNKDQSSLPNLSGTLSGDAANLLRVYYSKHFLTYPRPQTKASEYFTYRLLTRTLSLGRQSIPLCETLLRYHSLHSLVLEACLWIHHHITCTQQRFQWSTPQLLSELLYSAQGMITAGESFLHTRQNLGRHTVFILPLNLFW